MASPSTSTLRSGTVSRLTAAGALEKSSTRRCGACCWNGAKKSPPNQPGPPLLRGEGRCGGACNPDQKRDRNRQRDQRAGLGEHAKKGSGLRHPARSQRKWKAPAIIAESGRKRADFAPING